MAVVCRYSCYDVIGCAVYEIIYGFNNEFLAFNIIMLSCENV